MRRRLLIAVLLVALFPATALATHFWWRAGTVHATPQNELRDLIAAEHRSACGSDLAHDAQLIWAARFKAQDMGYNGYFGHTTSSGKAMWDLYARAGVPWSSASEILAWNNYPDDSSAAAAFRAFMSSASHRSAIRNCTFTRFGVGVFRVAGGKKYYAVEFTRP